MDNEVYLIRCSHEEEKGYADNGCQTMNVIKTRTASHCANVERSRNAFLPFLQEQTVYLAVNTDAADMGTPICRTST